MHEELAYAWRALLQVVLHLKAKWLTSREMAYSVVAPRYCNTWFNDLFQLLALQSFRHQFKILPSLWQPFFGISSWILFFWFLWITNSVFVISCWLCNHVHGLPPWKFICLEGGISGDTEAIWICLGDWIAAFGNKFINCTSLKWSSWLKSKQPIDW